MSDDIVIGVEDVHLSFPIKQFRSRGVKEAFLKFVRREKLDEAAVFWAINGVSFNVKKGEVLGLVGKNGSGKSTLLRVICKIYEPDKGRTWTKGRISSLLELGSGFKEELSGYENIRLSAAVMGFSEQETEQLLPQIVEFSGLHEFLDRALKTYSSGMRARLGFSVASSVDPEILVIDEALAVGDASFKAKSVERIEAMVKNDNVTVVVVSHSVPDLQRVCTRLLLLDKGLKVGEGSVEDVLKQYNVLTKKTADVRK